MTIDAEERARRISLAIEALCWDCFENDHEPCEREAGYYWDDRPGRCACWATGHELVMNDE